MQYEHACTETRGALIEIESHEPADKFSHGVDAHHRRYRDCFHRHIPYLKPVVENYFFRSFYVEASMNSCSKLASFIARLSLNFENGWNLLRRTMTMFWWSSCFSTVFTHGRGTQSTEIKLLPLSKRLPRGDSSLGCLYTSTMLVSNTHSTRSIIYG